MKKLLLIIAALFILNSCAGIEPCFFSDDFQYANYQSSIDTRFNYLEDIHILISCGDTSCPPKYGYN